MIAVIGMTEVLLARMVSERTWRSISAKSFCLSGRGEGGKPALIRHCEPPKSSLFYAPVIPMLSRRMLSRGYPETKMARQSLTDIGVGKLKPKGARYNYADPNLPGFYVRVTPAGSKTFAAIVRNPAGKQELITIGDAATLPIAEARGRARVAMQRVKDGLPAFPPAAASFGSVAMEWVVRKAEADDFRALPEYRRHLTQNILPAWNDLAISAIGKAAIAELLDNVQDERGARSADCCLTIIRMILRWHASRTDNYNPPLFIGMQRQSPKKARRSRTLDDHEIRRIWAAAEAGGTYGALIKTLLLTAQRLDKAVTMFWSDLHADAWKIRTEDVREKAHGGTLRLPPLARSVLAGLPHFAGNPYVFAGRKGRISGLSKRKVQFDKLCGVTDWTLHDLRRSARTLMPRAGVSADVAERVLGHAMEGIRGTYDWHTYTDEKADALQRLADLVAEITKPGPKLVARRA
jgi:integrase